jgi:sterol desaturase/sphingolipid hydroxylase (fatty acid hydroxylase superfamily)
MTAALPPPTGSPLPLRAPRRWPARLAALALVAVAAFVRPSGWAIVPVLFVLVVPFERLFPRHRQPLRRPHLGTDLAYALAAPALGVATVVVGAVVGVASLAWVPGLALRPLVSLCPPVPRAVLGVVLFDLAGYWAHRFLHEVPFLWRFHAVHHSTVHLDWISGLRSHPFDGALVAPPFVLLLAAGFDPRFSGALAVVQAVSGLFLHANVRWRWRALQRVVATPEFHHWHHADEADAHNSNYAAFLPVWDVVFGTWFMPPARRPQRCGISEPMPSRLVHQLRYPLRDLPRVRDVVRRGLRHPVRSVRHLGRSVRRGLGQVWASVRRPVRARVR